MHNSVRMIPIATKRGAYLLIVVFLVLASVQLWHVRQTVEAPRLPDVLRMAKSPPPVDGLKTAEAASSVDESKSAGTVENAPVVEGQNLVSGTSCKPEEKTSRPQRSRPKIAIITLYLGGLPGYAYHTMTDKFLYAAQHGYLHFPVFVPAHRITPDRPAVWSKLPVAEQFFNDGYDWVWLADSDLVITNHSVKVEDLIPQKDWFSNMGKDVAQLPDERVTVIATDDANGFNFGSTLMRADPWTLALLKDAWVVNQQQVPSLPLLQEQAAINYVVQTRPERNKHWLSIPQHLLNSYKPPPHAVHPNSRDWMRGDFVVHYPGVVNFHREPLIMASFHDRVGLMDVDGATDAWTGPNWYWLRESEDTKTAS